MRHAARSCLLSLSLLFLSSLALAQRERRPFFERLSDSGAGGVAELALDPEAYGRATVLHARGLSFELAHLPLPGGIEVSAQLAPVSAMAEGARAQVVNEDGSITWVAPTVKCFSGWLAGGGEMFLGLTPEGVEGYVRRGAEFYFLSSGGSPSGRATLAHASQTGTGVSPFCGLPGGVLPFDPGVSPRALVSANVKTADLFIEADNKYRQLFGTTYRCINYTTLLITAVSEIYRRDLGARLNIPNGYLRVWTSVPPWGAITTFGDISSVQSYWSSAANPDRNLPRAAVHVLTYPVFGGVAYNIGGICQNAQGYEISSVFGHFPYPVAHTHNDNWDLFVVAHEFGHSFGCIHSFDFTPPIECQDGSGPDSGTIMSYCHQTFGTGGVGMRFHLREQQRIRNYMATASCLVTTTLLSGDYDMDGARDPDDLVAANGILVQGFRSLGAEQTLDMDGDADFDVADRDLLAASLAPPASATLRNGSGVNPQCLLGFTNPLLGSTWEPQVAALGVGHPTLLWFYSTPSPGLATAFGELLVGGVRLVALTAPSDGLFATYHVAIPIDAALVGFTASVQGIIVGAPGGTQLCNALDLVLSTYE
ncbi:MAG: hypothetical protein EXS08_06000 [Planctomycetes bacterium]|nr:hypothetical protein [Planctomycetota bacterium]